MVPCNPSRGGSRCQPSFRAEQRIISAPWPSSSPSSLADLPTPLRAGVHGPRTRPSSSRVGGTWRVLLALPLAPPSGKLAQIRPHLHFTRLSTFQVLGKGAPTLGPRRMDAGVSGEALSVWEVRVRESLGRRHYQHEDGRSLGFGRRGFGSGGLGARGS